MSQPAQIGMDVDAMDVIVCDRPAGAPRWRASFVEDERRLPLEFVALRIPGPCCGLSAATNAAILRGAMQRPAEEFRVPPERLFPHLHP